MGPVDLLAKYITPLATIYAYEGSVRITARGGRDKTLKLEGRILENFYGNQEFLVPFMEINRVHELVGTSIPTPEMGGTFAKLVITKDGDAEVGLYHVGYDYGSRLLSVDLDANGILRLLNAARIALQSSDSFYYDTEFWEAKAVLGLSQVFITDQSITIDPGECQSVVRIKRQVAPTWMKCFAALDELEQCERGSQRRVDVDVTFYKTGGDNYSLKFLEAENDLLLVGGESFFYGIQNLLERFWFGDESIFWDEEGEFADVDDDDDYEGGGVS